MKLSSYLIGSIAAKTWGQFVPAFFEESSETRLRALDERSGSCILREKWVKQNPEILRAVSCPLGTDIMYKTGTTIGDLGIYNSFLTKWSTDYPNVSPYFGLSGLMYGGPDMNQLILPPSLCSCFVGCDTMQENVDSSPKSICCEDWDVIALEHCPKVNDDDDVVSPCPSTECWTYDADTHTCSMSGSCATLSCDSTQFDIKFSSELFNLDTQSPGTFAGGLVPTWDGSLWSFTTALGDNGMTYSIDSEDGLTFSLPLTMIGNDMRERSDDTVQDNVIVLGSQSVVTTPFGASIVFTCNYATTVELTSEAYTVAGASVVDTFSGTGSLSAGFAMSLNNGDGSAFLLGNNVQVGITWAVTALSDLTFVIQKCDVKHGAAVIAIVKDQCYAAALDVVPTDHMDQGFSYQVFKGIGEADETQKITCSVTICEEYRCSTPFSNSACPNDGDDVYYNFQMNPAHDN